MALLALASPKSVGRPGLKARLTRNVVADGLGKVCRHKVQSNLLYALNLVKDLHSLVDFFDYAAPALALVSPAARNRKCRATSCDLDEKCLIWRAR